MRGVKLAVAALVGAAGVATTSYADVITEWNAILLDTIRVDKTAPPVASRAMAMVHAAMYDAVVNTTGSHYQPYHVNGGAAPGTSATAAAASAAHSVLISLFPGQKDALDAKYAASLASMPDGSGKTKGVTFGQSVGSSVLALRANDGSGDVVNYIPGDQPGDWIPTPPGYLPAALPQWPKVTPFAMNSGDQFRGGGPPALDSAEYAAGYNYVKEIGRVDSAVRTADQTEVAHFWINGPGTATPPGHWNQIAAHVAQQQGTTLVESARLFAILNVSQADAAIVSWDSKYEYNHWRPVTGIQMGDLDGNDATEGDPDWLPLIVTPPFPAYTSGHSTFSASAAVVLGLFFGTDAIPFMIDSDGLPDTFRSFDGFWHAAEESGISRIYGGIHWDWDNVDALASGALLGEFVYANFFVVPAPSVGLVALAGAGFLASRRRRD
jgi:hypothetical protein